MADQHYGTGESRSMPPLVAIATSPGGDIIFGDTRLDVARSPIWNKCGRSRHQS